MTRSPLQLKVLPAAARAISEQTEYYREHVYESVVENWRTSVNRAIRSLRSMPDRGAHVITTVAFLRDIRWLPIQDFPKHLLFYRFDESSNEVLIVSVIHGARDLESILAMDAQQ